MSDRETGTVKWFNVRKGYGFIEADSRDKDVFLHKSQAPDPAPSEDDELTFKVEEGPKGFKAVDAMRATAGSGTLPLYQGAEPANPANTDANAGLVFDKFCDTWKPNFRGFEEPKNDDPWDSRGKWAWLGKFQNLRPGDPEMLNRYASRRTDLIAARDGFCLQFESTSRFVTGLGLRHPVENGFAWHPTLGTPFLPGSSVKGLVRAWADEWERADENDLAALFGRGGDDRAQVGDVIFFDATPIEPPKLTVDVMTPHYQPWYQGQTDQQGNLVPPADWHSPNPIPFLVVEAGARFQFGLAPRGGCDVLLERLRTWLEEALEWIGAGAKTAVGYGRFDLSEDSASRTES